MGLWKASAYKIKLIFLNSPDVIERPMTMDKQEKGT